MDNSYQSIYSAQTKYFKSGATRSIEFRKQQLDKLEAMLRNNETAIQEALYKDLRKHPQEVYMTELGGVYEEIKDLKAGLREWMRPRKTGSPFFLFPASSMLYPEPVGNVLIISPWNYPIYITMNPLAGAIAAGNTIIIKPSEYSVHTSELMAKLINEYFPSEYIYVFLGDGAEVVPALLKNFHFDQVFFTGSTPVGKKIMEMAASHLSPVTLELGGKSPCIISADANLTVAAKRIIWGKFVNAGQTCVAADYLLVEESIKGKLVQVLINELENCYGENQQQSDSYARIINRKRFDTLVSYFSQGNTLYGGKSDAADNYIGPTLMDNVSLDSPLMQEEIFGPILPIFTYKDKSEALQIIERNPYPLALYVFTGNSATEKYFIENVRFGGGCINETVLNLGNSELPFGGVGYSGHGAYHGKFSFDTFTHLKGVVKRATWFEPSFRHAPFGGFKTKIWRWLLGR